MNLKSLTALILAATVPVVLGGPIAYGLCQTGCNALVVTCYAAAGFTFGMTVVGVPPAIIACNGALGTCMAACAATALIAPVP